MVPVPCGQIHPDPMATGRRCTRRGVQVLCGSLPGQSCFCLFFVSFWVHRQTCFNLYGIIWVCIRETPQVTTPWKQDQSTHWEVPLSHHANPRTLTRWAHEKPSKARPALFVRSFRLHHTCLIFLNFHTGNSWGHPKLLQNTGALAVAQKISTQSDGEPLVNFCLSIRPRMNSADKPVNTSMKTIGAFLQTAFHDRRLRFGINIIQYQPLPSLSNREGRDLRR